MTGVDAARGAALVAMMAIHILPSWNGDYEPTLTWTLLAGRGAALFAVLAGLSLAFMSGGQHPPVGRAMTATRYGLAARAVLITVIGLFLGYLAIAAQVILVYYGVMFLLALPLLRLSVRALLGLAAGIAVAAPFLMQATRDSLPDMEGVEPTFSTLAAMPGDVVGQVLLTGTYPALPWMAYVCVGLAIGRLDLARRAVQIRLVVVGVCLTAVTAFLSAVLLKLFGGQERLVDAAAVWSSSPESVVNDILIWGPNSALPTDTFWWLASLAPYSSTPLALLSTIGTSAAFLGLLLLAGRAARAVLMPLATLGKMTLTLYSLHLLLLATGLLEEYPPMALIIQLMTITGFAFMWLRYRSQGPLEQVVAEASKWVRSNYLDVAARLASERASSAGELSAPQLPAASQEPSREPSRQEPAPSALPAGRHLPEMPAPPSVPPTVQLNPPSLSSDAPAPPSSRRATEAEDRIRCRARQDS